MQSHLLGDLVNLVKEAHRRKTVRLYFLPVMKMKEIEAL